MAKWILYLCFAVATAPGLLSAQSQRGDSVVRVTWPRQWGDTTGLSTLNVVVRGVWWPDKSIGQARIDIVSGSDSVRRYANSVGEIQLLDLKPGAYDIVVAAIGYTGFHARVYLSRGCPAWLEVYLSINPCDIGACPPVAQSRAVLSSCPPTP